MYKVIRDFTDLKDKNHFYQAGKDTFPREGLEVDEERLRELAGKDNKQGTPLIQLDEVKDTKTGTKSTKSPKKKTDADKK